MTYGDLLATLAAVISDRYLRNDLLHHEAVTKDKALGHDKPPRAFCRAPSRGFDERS
jgi:hypothetical protein